jgi:hypothetical protein
LSVVALRDLKKNRGATGSHTFECDDGRKYLVKFRDRTRSAINEYVGYRVAGYFGLPVPESRIVKVSQEMIDGSPDLRVRGLSGGEHHGSLLLEDSVDLYRIDVPSLRPTNADRLPGVVVFDNLVLNHDRNNHSNNLVRANAEGKQEYWMVDFNEILAGPRWTIETMNKAKAFTYLMPVPYFIALAVRDAESLAPWLAKMDSISEDVIEGLLAEVPESWDIGEPEAASIMDFLLTRRSLVRGILDASHARFPNWK